MVNKIISFRLLSELYSLLCTSKDIIIKRLNVSVSSRSYILSYNLKNELIGSVENAIKFPSPLGVIFSLILFVEVIP